MIKKLHIERFKSISHAEVDLFKANFLIGQNGAGKTTLLSSIVLLRLLSTGQNVNVAASSIAPTTAELFFEGRTEQSIFMSFIIGTEDPDKNYELEFSIIYSNPGELKINHEKLSVTHSSNDWTTLYKRLPGEFRANVDGELRQIPLAVKDSELALSTYSSDETNEIVSIMSGGNDLWSDTDSRGLHFTIQSSEIVQRDSIDWLVVSLTDNKSGDYNEATEFIQKILPYFKKPQTTLVSPKLMKKSENDGGASAAKSKRYAVFWPLRFSDTEFYTLASLSNGERRVIQVILSLYQANKHSTVTVEEIENGLHPTRIRDLIHVLKHVSAKRDIQIIVSTHSTHVLDALMAADLISVKYTEKRSLYRRATQTKEFELIKDELGHEPSAEELVNSGILL